MLLESLEPRVLLTGYAALQRPTELQYWDATRADNGYNFFGAGGTTYLLDMEGKVVHTWPIGTNPHLLSNGNVLDAMNDDPSGFTGFKEVDWSGNTVWSYLDARSTYHPHHDFTRILNTELNQYTTLYIANKDYTYAELVAAGADPSRTPSTGGQMDTIVEVNSAGTIVWEWDFFDHIIQDYDSTKPNYVATGKTISDYPGKLDINLDGHNLKSDWLHCNSMDYNPSLDQIVVNSVQGEFYVIDHGGTFIAGDPTASIALAATTAGDFLYRFGDPARYDQGSKPAILEDWTQSTTGTKQMGGTHDIQWIADGLPGAGHFLLFNNGQYLSEHTSQSYVMEINPYLDAGGNDTGHYVNPPDAGYNTVVSPAVTDKTPKLVSKQVVWNYATESNLTLFSQIGCSAQRLFNGNTLICADTEGYIMEVTPSGDTVWDYIVPVTKSGNVLVIGDNLPMVNSIFRAYRYEAGYSAFAGRTLTPVATIAGRTTVANPYAGDADYDALQRQTETQYWDSTNAYNGYTFFAAQGTSYLIDMQGRVAKTWATGTDPRMLDSGNVLDWATNTSGNTGLKELDWNGNTAWEYYETRTGYHPHGDFRRIYDPKLGAYATLYLANKDVTAAECIAAGCDPADAPYDGAQVDTIVEVDMSGNIVWEWSFWDHAIQDVDATKANYAGAGMTVANYPGKINLNLPGRPLRSNWLDCNSLDYNQSLDQIVVNSRQGEFYIIDHGNTMVADNATASIALAATTAGDFLYRFGDPARYSQGNSPSVSSTWESATSGNKQIGGSSDVQWIAAGLPGAGHLLVFNNNQYLYQRTPQSYVFEVNPYLDSSGADTGAYVNPPTAGYNTWTFDKDTHKANQLLSKQVVWKHGSTSNLTLFSHFGSSAQRLLNGNTLICATTEGYMVEVDASGNVVWEYINPVTNAGIVTAIGDDLPMTNAVPRAVRYPASFSGFQGHTLTPGATITGNVFSSPTITGTTRTPTAPSATDAVWVTSQITDDGSIASASLTYSAGNGTPTTTTPFGETFGTTATTGTNNWTGGSGTGTDTVWTVVAAPASFKLGTSSNYVSSSSAVGVQYNCSKATTATLTSSSINAAGTSGYVTFWVKTTGTLSGNDGWALQLGSGTTFTQVTPTAGTTNSNGFTPYTYTFDSSQLVNGLQLQFKFTGNGGTDTGRISLDEVAVSLTSGGGSTSTVTMYDDGAHGDGAAGDHVYGAQIPALATGTEVSYYVSATDNSGLTAVDPATAPADKYSYTVQTNSAPTDVSLSSATVAENQPSGTAVGTLSTTDPDTGNIFAYNLVSGTGGDDNGSFTISGGTLQTAASFDYETKNSYSIRVRSTDQGGLYTEKVFTISVTHVNETPTVAMAASASPSPVTSTTTVLSALGADVDTGESSLTYTWTATVVPSGAPAPAFIANGTNAAKSTTATFSKAGSYTFQVAITDPGGLSATSSVSATVDQTLTTITVSPASVSLNAAGTQQFMATANDQFGNVLTTQPTFTWTTTVGTISTAGLLTAPSTAGSGTVTAASAAISGNASVTVTSTSHPYTMSALPDSGQVASYSTIYGEDSDYAINPPTYKSNGDGTITDKVTDLMWQQTDGGEMTWEQAVAYADSLTLGGYTDWRLPFSKELFSILDESTINPAMNTTYFPASAAEYWWSSDVAVDNAAKVWVANAGGGIGPHPKTETISAGGSKRFHVRCVRDPLATGATHLYGNLTANGDGTVSDNHTGLVWQQAESTAMTWEEAVSYAENLTLGGKSDWRLPNIKELQSVSDNNFRAPSMDKTYFPGATATRYWSSTSLINDTTKAWYLDSDYGLTSYDAKTGLWHVRCVRGGTATNYSAPALKVIPKGSFSMGDHFGYVDPGHPTDELPLHTVAIDAFSMGTYDITNQQYCAYLNSALAQGLIEVRNGLVYAPGGSTIYAETRQGESALFGIIYSGINWDGTSFSVYSGRESHPMVGVRWEGAAAYCNWLSAVQGYQPVYNLTTWVANFTNNGYRLPTEAEWEYAADGGHTDPYYQFPWGNNTNTDGTWANWSNSGDPYETGDYPWTTPVGFYDGTLHLKSDFNWPGAATSYQTSNAVNGFGLYDMAGEVWQWTNDLYDADYYSTSPSSNPTGPTTGDPMPDGNAYRVLRGGQWYNGAEYLGHARISNRDPAYYRGPQDPNHPYYHVGFRVALKTTSIVAAGANDTTLVSTLQFGEGPAADSSGNVYFSDVKANTIYKRSAAGAVSVFRTNSGGANGLAVDASGNVIACEGTNGRVVSISPAGVVTVLASQYNGTRFNEPNDLWLAPNGGIYFTDPVFFGAQVQDAQAVYYINPARTSVTRVISDMTKPNGLVGTSDGTTLYMSDYGAGATYKYTINSDGTLTGKTLFASLGSDGMEIDSDGNVYMTTDDVVVYNSAGTKIETINVLQRPTNLCFAGTDRRTLFITTEGALYSIAMRTQGLAATVANAAPTITGTTRTPASPSATDNVWVTSTVTDDSSVSSVKLTYSTGSGTGTTTTPFTENFGTTAVKPWTGATGSTNPWTVTGNYVELRTGANYVTSTTACGVEYKAGATVNALTAAMMATTNSINAAGTSAYVEFWLQSLTLTGTAGWTFQVSTDGGTTWTTRLSELTGNSHAFQKYHYDLATSELVSTLKMRFQFTGGGSGTDHRIDVDQITVTVTTGSTATDVTMYDDGAHGDGTAGDHVYGGQIPAKATGTTVTYYVTATDNSGLSSTDPATAPTDKYSYIVGHTTPQLQLNEFLADSTTFTATTDYPTQTVGLLLGSESGVWAGYTLLAPKHNVHTYLLDTAGRVVHSWTSAYVPGQSAYLLPNGHLLRSCMITGPLSSGGGEGGRIEEYDWDGNLVWGFNYSSDLYMQHHDFKPLPNGNVLLLAVEKRTYAEALAAGFNPALLDSQITSKGYMLPDSVVEIQPVGSSGGNVVWKWSVWDHLVQDHDATKANYGVPANHPELVDPNGYTETSKIMQFWNHMNSLDYNAELDQILLSVRGSSEVWIIDHSTTTAQAAGHTGGLRGKGGDLLYRWGNPVTYDAGTAASQTLFDQHDAQWIDAGYPGAGHILVFNNGLGRNYSSVDEFVPPMDAAGNYIITAGSAYGPSSLYWTYHAPNPSDLYSEAISGAQRLANGNTLICDGVHGVLSEVTSAGALVWKYVNPEINTGILYQGDTSPLDIRGHNYNAVFKVERYATDFAAFAGRELSPSGPLELYRNWIEVRNPGTSAVDMSGMYLTNDASTPTKFQIPTGVSIPAGGYLIFWADNLTTAGNRHTNFTLSSAGGAISLYDIDGITRVDTITYGAQTTNVSYGRYPNGTGTWQAMSGVTPGTANTAPANQAPTDIATSASTAAENQAAGTTVGTLSTTDPDSGNTFTYSLVTGTGSTDNASFTISGSTLQTAATFDYETKNSYSIRVRSTDQGGLYTEKIFTINVPNVNEAPTDIALSASSIAENQPAGTAVGTLSTTDPDLGNTFTYLLVAGAGGTDNGSFTISGNTLKNAASFDYEVKNSFSIRVCSTDQGGLYTEKVFTISVTNANEVPTAHAGGPYLIGIGTQLNLDAGLSTDPDASSGDRIVAYAWDFNNDGQFDLSTAGLTATLSYTLLAGLGVGTHTIGLKVTDSLGLTGTATTTLDIRGADISGTAQGDVIHIARNATDAAKADVSITTAGSTLNYSVVLSLVPKWIVSGGDGDDELTVDFSQGDPLPSGGLSYDGGTHTAGDSFVVRGTADDDTVIVTPGSVTFVSGTIAHAMTYTDTECFALDGGIGKDSLIFSGATLRLDRDNAISDNTAVTINSGSLDLDGRTETVDALLVRGGSIVNGKLRANPLTVQEGTIGVGLGGQATLTKLGTGTAVLTTANSYTGGTEVTAGTLVVQSAGALPAGGSLTIGSGGTLVLSSGLSAGATQAKATAVPSVPATVVPVVQAATPPAITTAATAATAIPIAGPPNRPASAIAKAKDAVLGSRNLAPPWADLRWLTDFDQFGAGVKSKSKDDSAIAAFDAALAKWR